MHVAGVPDDEAGPVVFSAKLEDHTSRFRIDREAGYAKQLDSGVWCGDTGNATTRIHLERGLAFSDSYSLAITVRDIVHRVGLGLKGRGQCLAVKLVHGDVLFGHIIGEIIWISFGYCQEGSV
jgi:hypothetical protein